MSSISTLTTNNENGDGNINYGDRNIYENISFDMFCNLDVLHHNPIKNGTNLLYNKYSKCQWYPSYSHFNRNTLLLLCNNFNKQSFFSNGFGYISKKCCQFMINLSICKKYHINSFNREYNFYYSKNSMELRQEFFRDDDKCKSFLSDYMCKYKKCQYESDNFQSKMHNIYYFIQFYLHVNSLVKKLKKLDNLRKKWRNGNGKTEKTQVKSFTQFRKKHKLPCKRILFSSLFECFNFWNVICDISAQKDLFGNVNGDNNDSDMGEMMILPAYTVGQDLLFAESSNTSSSTSTSIHARYASETMLKLMVKLFGDQLDSGDKNLSKLTQKEDDNGGSAGYTGYTWHEFMFALLFQGEIFVRTNVTVYHAELWSMNDEVMNNLDMDDDYYGDGKIDDPTEHGTLLLHARASLKRVLFDKNRYSWDNTVGLFRKNVLLSMYIFGNKRFGNGNYENEKLFQRLIGDLNIAMNNGRTSPFDTHLVSFIQDNMYYKILIVADYLLTKHRLSKLNKIKLLSRKNVKEIGKVVYHPHWKFYCDIMYKDDILEELRLNEVVHMYDDVIYDVIVEYYVENLSTMQLKHGVKGWDGKYEFKTSTLCVGKWKLVQKKRCGQ